MGQSYVVTTNKGGAGKTLAAFNIGAGLALKGKSVVLIDGDLDMPNLHKIAEIEGNMEEAIRLEDCEHHLTPLTTDKYWDCPMLIRDKHYANLYFIPAQFLRHDDWSFPKYIKKLVWFLKEMFDFVIIDCPSGIGRSFESIAYSVDKAIIITTPEILSIRDAEAIIEKLKKYGILDRMLIINKITLHPFDSIDTLDVEDILSILPTKLIGIIPEDDSIIDFTCNRTLIATNENNRTGQAYRNIVRRILGEQVEFLGLNNEKTYLSKTIDRLSSMFIDYFAMNQEAHI